MTTDRAPRRPVLRFLSAVAAAILFGGAPAAGEPASEQLIIGERDNEIAVTRYAVEGSRLRPAALILHGSSGFEVNGRSYEAHARALAAAGIDAYLVRYFNAGANTCCWEDWARNVGRVVAAVRQRPEASGRIGLVGFSLGGAVAVASVRNAPVAAVVVFYGFIPDDDRQVPDQLPPLLVLHGDADSIVPVRSGQRLVDLARRRGGRAELVVYPGEGHTLSTWSESAAADAVGRSVSFLKDELVRP